MGCLAEIYRCGTRIAHICGHDHFVEKSLRGGISMVSMWFMKADNLIDAVYVPSKPITHIL